MPDPKKPDLTLQEIVAFQRPQSLHDWTPTLDTQGGMSYRAHVNGIHYIATPDAWEGRVLPLTKGNIMGSLANGVEGLQNAIPGEFMSNNPGFRPPGAESSTNCPTPEPIPFDGVMGFSFDKLLVPGAILLAAAALYFKKTKGS